MYSNNKMGGISILGIFILGFILILILGHLNISIKEEVENPTTQNNINYVGDSSSSIWSKYIAGPVSYLWHRIFIPHVWNPFVEAMNALRRGENTDFQNVPLIPSVSSD